LKFLPVTVTGVPSMHICLDFIPELLRQPEIEKQVSFLS
jgi:integrator complex subunit 2